jgi:hypothetical protein
MIPAFDVAFLFREKSGRVINGKTLTVKKITIQQPQSCNHPLCPPSENRGE